MPRGPDLSPNEVAMVHSKIKQFWDYEKSQIKHGGTKEIRKSCKISGIPVSERTLRRIAAHNGGKKRQKSTGSAVDLSVNVDDYEVPVMVPISTLKISCFSNHTLSLPHNNSRCNYIEPHNESA